MRFNPLSGMAKTARSLHHPRPGRAPRAAGHDLRTAHDRRVERQRRRRVRGCHPRRRRHGHQRRLGAVRRTVTNSDGFFAFAALPAPTYTVKVSISGFNSYEVTGVELRSGDSRSLRQVALKVATVAETVSVSAEVALTPLNSGEKSATLTSEQIENIPIVGTSRGRGAPAAARHDASTNGTSNKPNFSGEIYGINGNGDGGQQSAIGNYCRQRQPHLGPRHHDRRRPRRRPRLQLRDLGQPEHRVRAGVQGPAVELRGRARQGPGGHERHQQAGRPRFPRLGLRLPPRLPPELERVVREQGRAPTRTKNKFNYPGFSVSGPLLIPGTDFNKNRDKVFFFAGFEYFGQTLDTGFVKSWVPTADMRNGDFSNAAAVGSGSFVNTVPNFPGGIMPASQIDPGRPGAAQRVPDCRTPTRRTTGGYNYVNNLLIDQNGWQGLARLDFNVSDNTKLFVRYNIQRETQPFVIGLWWRNGERQVPYPSSISGKNRSDSVTVSLTHVFNPTLTNETIFAVTYINFPNQFDNRQRDLPLGARLPVPGRLRPEQRPDPVGRPGRLGRQRPDDTSTPAASTRSCSRRSGRSRRRTTSRRCGACTRSRRASTTSTSRTPSPATTTPTATSIAGHLGGRQHGQHVRRPPAGRPDRRTTSRRRTTSTTCTTTWARATSRTPGSSSPG